MSEHLATWAKEAFDWIEDSRCVCSLDRKYLCARCSMLKDYLDAMREGRDMEDCQKLGALAWDAVLVSLHRHAEHPNREHRLWLDVVRYRSKYLEDLERTTGQTERKSLRG